jgi:hypothetical protein
MDERNAREEVCLKEKKKAWGLLAYSARCPQHLKQAHVVPAKDALEWCFETPS